MRVLALEAYYAGSHQAFLDHFAAHSQHEFTCLTLPARKWKWRMRHAAVTFAEQARQLIDQGAGFDAVLATDMLNLAEWRALAPAEIAAVPHVLYFHENQFTYPMQVEDERDLHFGFTNLISALAADAVWFNSAFHRDDFLQAAARGLRKMPDYRLPDVCAKVGRRAGVFYPGIEVGAFVSAQSNDASQALRIAWVSRWEHDKGPETFFAALDELERRGVEFALVMLGEHFDQQPAIFREAQAVLAQRVAHWGYVPSREAYARWLGSCDLVVSTATHEFFGIAIMEALAAGCVPLLPNRLSYPELLNDLDDRLRSICLYDGSVDGLVRHIVLLDQLRRNDCGGGEASDASDTQASWRSLRAECRSRAERFDWKQQARAMDEALSGVRPAGR